MIGKWCYLNLFFEWPFYNRQLHNLPVFPTTLPHPPLPTRTFFSIWILQFIISSKVVFFFLTSPLLKFCSVTNSSRKETEFQLLSSSFSAFLLVPLNEDLTPSERLLVLSRTFIPFLQHLQFLLLKRNQKFKCRN